MGCLDSVPDDSPEGRARHEEGKLKLDQFNCDHIKAAFFLLGDGTNISGADLDKAWATLKDKGLNITLGDDAATAREKAFATFKSVFKC
jgi:hypothetical protein